MAYGDEHDNSRVGEIVRFVKAQSGLSDIEKQVLVNRLSKRPTAEESDAARKQVEATGKEGGRLRREFRIYKLHAGLDGVANAKSRCLVEVPNCRFEEFADASSHLEGTLSVIVEDHTILEVWTNEKKSHADDDYK